MVYSDSHIRRDRDRHSETYRSTQERKHWHLTHIAHSGRARKKRAAAPPILYLPARQTVCCRVKEERRARARAGQREKELALVRSHECRI
jgi:hypothetical protein